MNDQARPQESRRNRDELRLAMAEWLAQRPELEDVVVSEVVVPESSGMSSETILVTTEWSHVGRRSENRLVFRLAPDPAGMPLFESYDLGAQFHTIADVSRLSDVPVPEPIWFEPDPVHLGSPFFVMQRCDGDVPADVMPYNFGDSFLFDGSAEDKARLQRSSVGLLADLHSIADPLTNFPYLAEAAGLETNSTGDTALRNHMRRMRQHYEYTVSDGLRSPLMERAFEWIDSNWPTANSTDNSTDNVSDNVSDPVLLWGDSRIGNVIYRDFKPVAVLDWEMATIGPRELDVSWMIFMHQFFEDIARQMELPGMPEFMRRDDVVELYEELTGHTLANMDFFAVVSALQHGIIMSQVGRRSIAFGATEMPEDIDDLIMHRRLLTDYMA